MAAKKNKHHKNWRACSKCGHYEPKLSKDPAWNKPEYIACPACEQCSFRLRTYDQMSYLEWKGEIGAGRSLREIARETRHARNN